jgi:CPA2 family monovalent cation:H+ antiporter-2
VGQTVAAILGDRGIPYVAIDRDPIHVAERRRAGQPVYFGDIRTLEILNSVGAARARAVVLTIGGGSSRESVVQRLRQYFPDLQVLARARDLAQARGMERAGVSVVVPETLEGSLRLAGLTLKRLGIPGAEVDAVLEDYRRDDYARLSDGDK